MLNHYTPFCVNGSSFYLFIVSVYDDFLPIPKLVRVWGCFYSFQIVRYTNKMKVIRCSKRLQTSYKQGNVMKYRSNLKNTYSPLYFLASLGSGGVVVTFFMYLMFMVPHKSHPMPTFEDLVNVFSTGSLLMSGLVIFAVIGVLYYAFLHFRLLIWNVKEYFLFKKTESFTHLKTSNDEVQLMAIPLTYAMSVNVMFILGALFVPSLWSAVESLFPIALLAFLAIGSYAIHIFITFFARVIAFGHFDCAKNNSLSQMLSIFAFAMVAVGLAAPGAMSHSTFISGVSLIFSIGFASVAVILLIIKIVLGFRAMFEHGINREAAVSLWIMIPILTILGIVHYRITMGLQHNFNMTVHPWDHVIVFTVIVMLQLFFALLGFKVMKLIGYCKDFISGDTKSVTAYAAICPGVAFFVMGNFLIHRGLISAGLLTQFSLSYWVLYFVLIMVQAKTIAVFFRLNVKMLKSSS